MNQALTEFFRCPESLIEFALTGKLSGESGFFKYGEDGICYGQVSSGSLGWTVTNGLHDISQDIRIEGSTVQLPFDPTQVINNLRFERYVEPLLRDEHSLYSNKGIRKMYYFVRPILPVSVRRHFQKMALRDGRKRPFPKWPVDWTVEILLERLLILAMKAKRVEEIPFIWFWPEGFRSCTIVTHDVETTRGRDHCAALMDINESFGIKSSFQVVPEGRYEVPDEYLENIRRRGFEINVQDLNHDGGLYSCKEEFLRRAKQINRHLADYRAQGFRAGVLYRNVEWYEALAIAYDMSIPNVAHLDPQRGGCCTVFPYFIGNILELPVTMAQDYTLFHILGDYSIELWKKQIGLILEKNGLVSVIIHPDYIIDARAERTYRALLGYLRQLRAEGKTWVCLPQEVNAWWRARRAMRLVNGNGKWRIEGEGKERARIAYARRSGDEVVYTVEGERGRD